jgi:hypothetical protein
VRYVLMIMGAGGPGCGHARERGRPGLAREGHSRQPRRLSGVRYVLVIKEGRRAPGLRPASPSRA